MQPLLFHRMSIRLFIQVEAAIYRWPGWIKRIQNAGLTRSMSRKGCSPDNSACEGFFGRMRCSTVVRGKVSYLRNLRSITQHIDSYMVWHRDTRIKQNRYANASRMVYEIRYKNQITGTNQYAKSRHSCIPIFNLKEEVHQMSGMV